MGRHEQENQENGLHAAGRRARYEQEYRDRLAGSPAMTFAALCDRFLDDCKHHVRESTYMTRAGIIKQMFVPAFGSTPLNELTPVKIREWQNGLIASNHYKPSTLSNLHGILVNVLNFACKYFSLPQNPAAIAGGMGTLKAKRKPTLLDARTVRPLHPVRTHPRAHCHILHAILDGLPNR